LPELPRGPRPTMKPSRGFTYYLYYICCESRMHTTAGTLCEWTTDGNSCQGSRKASDRPCTFRCAPVTSLYTLKRLNHSKRLKMYEDWTSLLHPSTMMVECSPDLQHYYFVFFESIDTAKPISAPNCWFLSSSAALC